MRSSAADIEGDVKAQGYAFSKAVEVPSSPPVVDGPARSVSTLKANLADLARFLEVPETAWLRATVKNTCFFGAFFDVWHPSRKSLSVQGFAHPGLWDSSKSRAEEVFQIGQEVKVRLIEVDFGSGSLNVTLKGAPVF